MRFIPAKVSDIFSNLDWIFYMYPSRLICLQFITCIKFSLLFVLINNHWLILFVQIFVHEKVNNYIFVLATSTLYGTIEFFKFLSRWHASKPLLKYIKYIMLTEVHYSIL